MKISALHLQVLRGEICPYCKGKVGIINMTNKEELTVSAVAYFGCINYPKCDSYTISKQTIFAPLGRLANKSLRVERTRAYKHFNTLINNYHLKEVDLYKEFAEVRELPIEYTHITLFGFDTLVAFTGWCIRKRLKTDYEDTGVYTNMSARKEVDGKQKFKRCVIVEHYDAKRTLVQFDDETRIVSNQVRVTKR